MAKEIEKRNQAFLIYQDDNGIARVNVRFEGEDVWLNVEQMKCHGDRSMTSQFLYQSTSNTRQSFQLSV